MIDASPHLLVLSAHEPGPGGCRGTELRLPMTSATTIWHGGRSGLHALLPGREVIVRPAAGRPGVERIWVDIMRVGGTIISFGREIAEVDAGPHRGRLRVVIPPHALARVLVRHPRLEPGHLMDIICIRSPDGPMAVHPGTSQLGLTSPPSPGAHSALVSGTATWYGELGCPAGHVHPSEYDHPTRPARAGNAEPTSRPYDGTPATPPSRGTPMPPPPGATPVIPRQRRAPSSGRPAPAPPRREDWLPVPGFALDGRGAAYPAVDPEGNAGGCPTAPRSCAPLPYLSLGSELLVRNDCAGTAGRVPIVECGCLAARFCDRCVECGASPRGRLVELTPAAFVDLGGDLATGCFNATVTPAIGTEQP